MNAPSTHRITVGYQRNAALGSLFSAQRSSVARNAARIARVAWPLIERLASTPFVFCVMAPFVGWAVMLMWVHERYSELMVQAVADGPGIVVGLWIVLAAAWVTIAHGLGRQRQASAVCLAIGALLLLQSVLPRPAHDTAVDELAQHGPTQRF